MDTSTSSTETPDILHPLSSLEWEERPSLPLEMRDAQAVFLDGTLHVGGGSTFRSLRDHARLYSCKPGGDGSWTTTDTPTYCYALTTYDSHLLLVGGIEYLSGQVTNKIYTMIDGEFKELLPPMKEKRSLSSVVSSGSVLAVAGGHGDSGPLSSVEVYNNGRTSGQSLPDACYYMKSVFHGDKWILIGGTRQGTKVYCVSLQSLVSGTEQSPWETLPDVPCPYSAAVVVDGRILSIGGGSDLNPTSSIYAYSPDTQSWIHVGDLPTPLHSTCAIVVPSGELMVLGGGTERPRSRQVFRAFIKMPLVDANLQFSISKLFRLDECGIKLIEELSKDRFRFYATTGVQLSKGDRQRAPSFSAKVYVELIFRAWLTSKRPTYPPTWESLFTVLRKMDLGHLAEQVGKYVTGSLPAIESSPQSPEPLVEEEGDSYQALREENEYLRKQLAQAEWSIQQLRGTDEQTLSGSKDQENESDDETFEQANRQLNSVVNDYKLAIGRLKKEVRQLRAENDDLRSSLPVKLEPTGPLASFKEVPEPSSSLQQPKQEEGLLKTEPETTPFTTETLLAPPTEVLMAESDATIKMHKEKVQQLLSENQTLRSQLALPAPVKTETTFNLPGVEVVGQTSVMVTNSEQSFHWTGYGFKLHIPHDPLPAGVDQCLLYISASIAGQYQFPDKNDLISAVYWVRCDPPCSFRRKITVAMQHCAVVEGSTNLRFVRASSHKKELPYYSFEKIEDCGSFTNHSSYGSILLDHFCGVGVVGESPVEKKYCSNVYYLGRELCNREIHFVVMRNHETYITMVKQHYDESRAVGQKPQPVGFRSDSITLDIPDDGVRVKGGWDIQPMMHPAVLQSDVDNHVPGQMIPHCQLRAKCSGKRKKMSTLTHKVKMIGAKKPYTYFMIVFDPYQSVPEPSTPTPAKFLSTGTLALRSPTPAGQVVKLDGPPQLSTRYTFSGPSPLPLALPGVANPETALSLPVGGMRESSLASLTPPYPELLPHQHTGYYPTTFGSTAYPSPYHRMQGSYQTGGLGESLISFGGAGPSTMLSSGIPKTSFTFENLERELKTVMRWHRLETNLRIPQEQLEEIELNYPKIDRQKLALVKVIVGNYQFSWEDICTALEKMEETMLATQIRSKYCNEDTSHSESISEDQSISASVGDKRRKEQSATTIEKEQVPTKRSKSEQSSEEQ